MQFVNNALRKELAKTHWHVNKQKKQTNKTNALNKHKNNL